MAVRCARFTQYRAGHGVPQNLADKRRVRAGACLEMLYVATAFRRNATNSGSQPFGAKGKRGNPRVSREAVGRGAMLGGEEDAAVQGDGVRGSTAKLR